MLKTNLSTEKSESGRKFDEIWEEVNDPEKRKKKEILERRKKRIENNKIDLAI